MPDVGHTLAADISLTGRDLTRALDMVVDVVAIGAAASHRQG